MDFLRSKLKCWLKIHQRKSSFRFKEIAERFRIYKFAYNKLKSIHSMRDRVTVEWEWLVMWATWKVHVFLTFKLHTEVIFLTILIKIFVKFLEKNHHWWNAFSISSIIFCWIHLIWDYQKGSIHNNNNRMHDKKTKSLFFELNLIVGKNGSILCLFLSLSLEYSSNAMRS